MCQRGYIEGYYGCLLSWPQRLALLEHLQRCHLDHYWYAPKEDVCHRLSWRQSYDNRWRQEFAAFCREAENRGVKVIAGMAPGLDFDFGHLSRYRAGDRSLEGCADMSVLVKKSQDLISDGAAIAALLLDDIDADFATRCGDFTSEGTAHAELANQLGATLDRPLWVVPRIYANELAADASDYLPDFVRTLDEQHTIVFCGSHIVAPQLAMPDWCASMVSPHKIVFWDNLYANDYCPRKLYVGPWTGRSQVESVLLNPTGMPATDALLLSIMSATDTSDDPVGCWREAMQQAGVPDVFYNVAEYFDKPPLPDCVPPTTNWADNLLRESQLEALEELLWRWKTPLSREWYPFLMSLKHDLLLATDELPRDRIIKTQSVPMTSRLLRDNLL